MEGDDLYGDSPKPASVPDDAPSTDTKPDDGESSALLPKTVLGGKTFEPGDKVELEIVKVYEDEVEVKYSHHDESSEGESAMDGAESKLDGMAEPAAPKAAGY
jgi:hypothetical protein